MNWLTLSKEQSSIMKKMVKKLHNYPKKLLVLTPGLD